MANWFKRLLGGASPGAGGVLTIRKRELALGIPVQVPFNIGGMRRGQRTACESCGGVLQEVLITTGGPTGDAALWREYPLAVDGWMCAKCGATALPRFLEPDEATTLLREGAAHAEADRLDEAEVSFRRVCNSWPAYAPARSNLGRLYERRVHLEDLGEARMVVIGRLLDTMELHLRDALRGENVPVVVVVAQLLPVLLRRGAEGAAREVLAEAAQREQLTAEERTALTELEDYVRLRGDLFARGSALVSPYMILQDKPRPTIHARARRIVTDGIALLLEHARANPASWQALFLAGKGYQTLGDNDGFEREFARAFAIAPNAAVGREYVLGLMQRERLVEAEVVARATCAADPADGGLVANLALVLLLAGKVDEARATIVRAWEMDKRDKVTAALFSAIDEVKQGRRPMPRSLAELERG